MCRWLEHSPLTAETGGWVASWPLLFFWPICHFTLSFLAIERKLYSTSPQLGMLATRGKCHFHDRDNPWVHQGHLLQPDPKWAWTGTSHWNNKFEASVIVHLNWFCVYSLSRFISPLSSCLPSYMFSFHLKGNRSSSLKLQNLTSCVRVLINMSRPCARVHTLNGSVLCQDIFALHELVMVSFQDMSRVPK